jgi:HEAT repeat protein
MNRPVFTNFLRPLCLLAWVLVGVINVTAQTTTVRSQPIYQQCQALSAGSSGDDAVARAVVALKDNDPRVRAQNARELSSACDKRAIEPLTDLLQDQDLSVRLAAIEALGKLGDPESVRALNELVDDKDWRVRLALVGALASFNTYHARNLVVNGIANPNGVEITDLDDMRVRCAAVLTANQLTDVVHSRKSVLFLHGFLQSKHEPVRQLAEQAMFALKSTRNGSSELIGLLKGSSNPEIRRWSAQWIGKLGIENGRDSLTEVAAKDPDTKVKQAAAEALKALNSGNRS